MPASNLKEPMIDVRDRTAAPRGWAVRSVGARNLLTFLMVFGPGLIVMEADNDAGTVSTYVQAGCAVRHTPHVDSDRTAADDLFRSGNGRAVRDRYGAGPRHDDLQAVRELVGTLFFVRFVPIQQGDRRDHGGRSPGQSGSPEHGHI
jgi:hypothetical protein